MKTTAYALVRRGYGLFFLVFVAALAGNAADRDVVPVKPKADSEAERLYAPDHLVKIEITLAPQDWQTLRRQHRNLISKERKQDPEGPYTRFKADVKIDGQELRSVAVAKKGLLGSVVSTRPSLRIILDGFVKDQRFAGLSRLTLNNNNQDPSQICQFFTYNLFRSAGLPASRCNFAHVVVNGEDLGIYSNVEPINKPFLKRHFGSAAGNLYEGRGDFTPTGMQILEKKNHQERTDRSDLASVMTALNTNPADLAKAIEQVIDLDGFLGFWALEVLVGHSDSYSGNANNFYLYHHPGDKRFRFIPWGADDVFHDPGLFILEKVPHSVKARSALTRRLYAHPAIRDRYLDRLRQLLATIWDEPKLIAQIDSAVAAFRPHLHLPQAVFEESLAENKRFILARRAQIEPELNGAPPVWPESVVPSEGGQKGAIRASFSTVWNEHLPRGPGNRGELSMEMTLGGKPVRLTNLMPGAGMDASSARPGYPLIALAGLDEPNKRFLVVWLAIDPFAFAARPLPIDFFTVFGVVAELSQAQIEQGLNVNQRAKLIGWLVGRLNLEKASQTPGEAIAGNLEAGMY